MNEVSQASYSPLLTMRIIVLSLAGGVTVFLIVVLGIVGLAFHPPGPITWLALAVAAGALAARSIVPNLMANAALQQLAARSAGGGGSGGGKAEREAAGAVWTAVAESSAGAAASAGGASAAAPVWIAYQTKTIVAAALTEGAAFFLVIAYLSERSHWALIAAVILVASILLLLPTQPRVDAWTAAARQKFVDEQSLGKRH